MIEASDMRGYDNYEHVEEQAWEQGYQAGLMNALRIIQDVGFTEEYEN
jgi:hypothetical protein